MMMQKGKLMSLIASIGIGAAAYNMMRPSHSMKRSMQNRIDKMAHQHEAFPEQ
ncbi:MAG: hypothetical protein ABF868_12410 [Sporolactobacillus sp.]